jgi:hypothetical protein
MPWQAGPAFNQPMNGTSFMVSITLLTWDNQIMILERRVHFACQMQGQGLAMQAEWSNLERI